MKEGWEERVVAPLNTATVFAKGTAHKVIAPNKVVQLKESSVVLEKEWEGKTEIPFFVSCCVKGGYEWKMGPGEMVSAPSLLHRLAYDIN